MLITLHKNARTTPAIRAEIAASNESTRALAKRFGVSELTIAKWRKRASVNDLPHTPHRLQTTLSPAQEAIVVELRKSLLSCPWVTWSLSPKNSFAQRLHAVA